MCEEGDGRDHRTDTHSVAALLKTRWERVENKAKILTMVEQKGGDVNEQMNYRTLDLTISGLLSLGIICNKFPYLR